jgi:hypothetical protein
MILVAAIGAFVGSLLTASVFSAIFATDRIRRPRHRHRAHRRDDRPYAL